MINYIVVAFTIGRAVVETLAAIFAILLAAIMIKNLKNKAPLTFLLIATKDPFSTWFLITGTFFGILAVFIGFSVIYNVVLGLPPTNEMQAITIYGLTIAPVFGGGALDVLLYYYLRYFKRFI